MQSSRHGDLAEFDLEIKWIFRLRRREKSSPKITSRINDRKHTKLAGHWIECKCSTSECSYGQWKRDVNGRIHGSTGCGKPIQNYIFGIRLGKFPLADGCD